MLIVSTMYQNNRPNWTTFSPFTIIKYSGIKNTVVRKIEEYEKSGVKFQCLTEERERLLVRVIGRFEKLRVREIEILLY